MLNVEHDWMDILNKTMDFRGAVQQFNQNSFKNVQQYAILVRDIKGNGHYLLVLVNLIKNDKTC